jgi:outer membrane protein assembly factor BamB
MATDSHAPSQPASSAASTDLLRSPRLVTIVALLGGYWLLIAAAKALASQEVLSQLTLFLTLFYAPFALAAAAIVWWLFFSRQKWAERLMGLALLAGGGFAALGLAHKSMMFGLLMDALPVAITAVVLTVVVTRLAPEPSRFLTVAAASFLAWGYFTLIRLDGITGALSPERSWRWEQTAEDRFLAERKKESASPSSTDSSLSTTHRSPSTAELAATAADWTQFRGPNRDGRVHHVSLTTDWTANPPRELWRRRVGPGWSSFAVVGKYAFTQEQRDKMEAVFCVDIDTGKEIWSHEDDSRFEETISGAGPRATPTFHAGKIYSLGGSGILNCLDAATGKLVWSKDITADAKAKPSDENLKPPGWGYSSSPLVVQGVVAVFAGGKEGKGVLAYDAATGELRWSAGKGTHSYSSPQLVKFGQDEQILMLSGHGLEAFEPATGKLLWEHDWNLQDMFRVVQPRLVGESELIISTPMMEGSRLLTVSKEGDAWTAKEKWTSKDFKPYFNDCVQLGDHLYGFDNDILVCIELATGKRKWKKGRYGNGQALLIGEEGQMLVLSETGEAVLTQVSPQELKELGKFKALSGKTWNHPVIAHGKLLVRNSEEMACYELAPKADAASTE